MYAFPTIDQLQAVTDEDLRANGFGYRAAYIRSTAQQLHAMPQGADYSRALSDMYAELAANGIKFLLVQVAVSGYCSSVRSHLRK